MPEEGDFVGGQAVGFVDEVAELAFELQGFGGLSACRFDGAGVSHEIAAATWKLQEDTVNPR